jgi:hypothetical protein
VIEVNTTNIRDFMRMLLVTEPHYSSGGWSFRGQGNSEWGLVPSIRRIEAWRALGGAEQWGLQSDLPHILVVSSEKEIDRVEAELADALRAAVKIMGLPPNLEENDALRAYARHIGLPTRVLDWSRSPWTAAYFAAATAIEWQAQEGRMSVFAMSDFYLNAHHMEHAERVFVNSAGNPNLLAQQGLLLVVRGSRPDLLEGVRVESREPGYKLDALELRILDHQLIRITLPWSLSGELLRLLRNQYVHSATLFPGQTGIAGLVKEVFLSQRIKPNVIDMSSPDPKEDSAYTSDQIGGERDKTDT